MDYVVQKQSWPKQCSLSPNSDHEDIGVQFDPNHVTIPNDGTDVWEIDMKHLKFEKQVASGSYGDLYVNLLFVSILLNFLYATLTFVFNCFSYKGVYCSQDVAIKVLKPERVNSEMEKEFAQEVFIMRFV